MKTNKTINRKLRKLKNNPYLFFYDLFKNRYKRFKNTIYLHLPKKKNEVKKFTIISAVYNVELYLEDYFKSLENQRLDFQTNINVIMVDDGSPDNSRKIIEKWVKKYPNNIFYIQKKNGGQSSARNLGIKYAKTEWVTFIDPDDFLDVNYFYLIEKSINSEQHVGALITKFKLFKEKFGTYHDGFQTDYCFTKPIRVLDASNMEDCVQFSSSSSVYKTDIIHQNNIIFDERLTASFEDTKFFYEYLYHLNKKTNQKIVYIRDALYYYRLRENESSSSNGQWAKKAKYQEFFTFGLLSVIELFKNKNNEIPPYIQRLILFSVIPYLQVASINKSRIEAVLNKNEILQLIKTIEKCLTHVDQNILETFYTSPGNYFWISAISNYFKYASCSDKRVYVNKVDLDNYLVYFRFYGVKGKTKFHMKLNGLPALPLSEKVITHKIFDSLLIQEFNLCYRIPPTTPIQLEIDGASAKIYSDFKLLGHEDTDFYEKYIQKNNTLKNIAIFIDSGYKADDNAEHLYTSWFIKNNLSVPFEHYYLLDKNSSHWKILFQKGFNLVDINSLKAQFLIKNARYIFSSYLPGHLNQWVKHHNFKFQKYVFLQHGVITSNLSKPFNASYSQIYKMVISTLFEKKEIMDEQYNYIFHETDLIPVGMPRLDNLVNKYMPTTKLKTTTKKILVCPTWRSKFNSLNLNLEKHQEDFLNSSYLTNWVNFLNSMLIEKLIDEKHIEIIFCPHINLYDLIEEYNLSDKIFKKINQKITILNPKMVSYQKLFLENDLLITDYSSLHFDFAALKKPVIYFQFDKNEFYGVSHAYQQGIFDFPENGFGPVVDDIDHLSTIVKNYASRGNRLFKKFSSRAQEAFLSLDGDNSSKIYKNIIEGAKYTNKEIL